MPCLKQPLQPACAGPDGAIPVMCTSCRQRKNSVAGLAIGGASGREIQQGWNVRLNVIVADLFQESLKAA